MTIHEIAVALAAALGAQSWPAPYSRISPVVSYTPEYDPEQLVELQVTVVPSSWSGELMSRGTSDEVTRVDIGVQKRATNADIPDLVALVRAIARHCLDLDLASEIQAEEVSVEPLYSPEHLLEDGVFISVITVSFKECAEL